ncbi:MAG: HlyD family efflux transporter periplasmic adaptor subunit [Gammaproteobacteria bacterium]|nr:HlyD family efflux transporter periplasmic adaptor subunit [Gammaproteobacteria bacterium]
MRRLIQPLALLVLLTGCTQGIDKSIAVEAVVDDHVFELQARGDIVSSESISINVPRNVNMRMNIAWILPEFSNVSKGDVVARFEIREIMSQRSNAMVQIANQSLAIHNHEMDSVTEQTGITHQSERVAGETVVAQTFADFDPRYFSRIEIIDAIGDLNYLGVEATYYDWRANTHEQRTVAETAHIQAQRAGAQQSLSRQDQALEAAEVRSPADGTFVYGQSPWGEKVRRGMTVFPGSTVGKLPVSDRYEARIFVPETDAVGLAASQLIKMRMDANASEELDATITSVAPIASARSRTDLRRFVTVTAALADSSHESIRVGSALSATIVTAELADAIVLPQQAIFTENQKSLVYVLDGSDVESRVVELGERSSTLVEIVNGLAPGEWVSLIEPELAASDA